jgi:hypothetical protein
MAIMMIMARCDFKALSIITKPPVSVLTAWHVPAAGRFAPTYGHVQ